MRRLRAILFDMDGVLIDSEPVHLEAMRRTLRARDLAVPDGRDWERVFFGRPDRDGLIDWFAEQHVNSPVLVEQVMAEKALLYREYFDALVRPFDDGQWLARRLAEHGFQLALVTGARRSEAELTLDRFDLRPIFQATVSGDDVRVGKPDPEPYALGARLLSLSAEHCLVVEDAPAGVRSATAAGAAVIAVDRLADPRRFAPFQPVAALDEAVLADILARG